MDQALIKIDAIRKELAEVSSIEEVLEIRSGMKAYYACALAKGRKDLAEIAKEGQLRAERRAGEFLAEEICHQGGRPEKRLQDATVNNNVKLADLGIEKTQSLRWQSIASVPEPEFEEYMAQRLESDKELTQAGLLRLAARIQREQAAKDEAKEISRIESILSPTDHKDCYYQDDWTQIWHGDALSLFFIPDDTIDLIVTSPPYNIGKKSGNGRVLWGGVEYSDSDDKKPEEEYQVEQIRALNEMWRVAKPGASIFYNHKVRNRNNEGIHPLSWLLKTKWTFRQQITWDRNSTHNHEMTYFWPVDELIFWLTKGTKGVYLSPEGAKMTTVWRFNFDIGTEHPAPFPEELATRCILAASKPGDLVLDPFGGSMTTCYVAKRLKRYSIGVDISKSYVIKFAYRCSQGVLL